VSQLDRYFDTLATRGLPVWPEIAVGENSYEPGYVYTFEAADVTAFFGIVLHRVADVAGMRFALKCVVASEDPALLKISAPDGQRVEGDDGFLSTGLVTCGSQTLGAYREWLCDQDGNWLMVRRIEGGGSVLPFGQIVIQGVPVVIQGVPLVNTVPAPLALRQPPRPVIPAVIVPRARPVVPPPGPSLPEVIELEDAFDDDSLMNALGEKLRMAQTLRAMLDAVLYFPFTLRTTSVDSASFESIGVLRLDATLFGADFVLTAELEVSASGQSVELQLYDLTAAAVVATLTSSSTTTENQTALVVLPLAGHLYDVRLRRVGGAPGELVSCRSVALRR